MRVGSLFSGIGGLDLGLERAGMSVVWQCEADAYCRAVLRKHWPDVPCYEDVRAITDPPAVDVLCGGFPCQPVSKAGKRKAQSDDRWLWPEFARLIRELRPRYALMENVPGLLTAAGGDAMGEVLGDLASIGFDGEWESIPASAVGAHHLRDRVFILAYPHADGVGRDEEGRTPAILHPRESEPWCESGQLHPSVAHAKGDGIEEQPEGTDAEALLGSGAGPGHRALDGDTPSRSQLPRRVAADGDAVLAHATSADAGGRRGEREGAEPAHRQSPQLLSHPGDRGREAESGDHHGPDPARGGVPGWTWASEPDVGRVADGVPSRVDRIRCLGNAVVPQVAEWIGRRILEAEGVT